MKNYVDFVKQTTSEPSLEYGAMASRLAELEVTGTNTTQLLTAALGLTAESGDDVICCCCLEYNIKVVPFHCGVALVVLVDVGFVVVASSRLCCFGDDDGHCHYPCQYDPTTTFFLFI